MQSSTGVRTTALASRKPRVNAADGGYKPAKTVNTYFKEVLYYEKQDQDRTCCHCYICRCADRQRNCYHRSDLCGTVESAGRNN